MDMAVARAGDERPEPRPSAPVPKSTPTPAPRPPSTTPLRWGLGGRAHMDVGSAGSGGGPGTLGTVGRQSARLRAGAATVSGKLTGDVIRRVIHARFAAFRYCYVSQALRANPQAKGRVFLHFVVSPAGRVTSARVEASTLKHRATEQCLLRVLRRVVFPKAAGVSVVRYPIVFSSR